jgi:hypothetical protein
MLLAGLSALTVGTASADSSSTIERVSVDSSGAQANDYSDNSAVSADGRYVVFSSRASNLVSDEAGGGIFLRDRQAETTVRVSGSGQNPTIAGNGSKIAFEADPSEIVTGYTGSSTVDVFVYDVASGAMTQGSVSSSGEPGDSSSIGASLSGDGSKLVFYSGATNLVDGDDNASSDIFLRDLSSGQTTIVSRTADGQLGNGSSSQPMISADGKHVVFVSSSSNFVSTYNSWGSDVFVKNLEGGAIIRASVMTGGYQMYGSAWEPKISENGQFVVFTTDHDHRYYGDPNSFDVYFRDVTGEVSTRVSVASDGESRYGISSGATISADGRYVAFQSSAQLAENDGNGVNDVYVRDRTNGTTTMITQNGGVAADSDSGGPQISADGKFVSFISNATNLVVDDTNSQSDIFVATIGDTALHAAPVVTSAILQDAVPTDALLKRGLAITASPSIGSSIKRFDYGWLPPLSTASKPATVQHCAVVTGQCKVSFAETVHDQAGWKLLVRVVDAAGKKSSWIPAKDVSGSESIQIPPLPVLVVLGDSIPSGHHRQSGEAQVTCNDENFGFPAYVRTRLEQALPAGWGDHDSDYYNFAKSGFSTTKVIDGGQDACHDSWSSPLDQAKSILASHAGSWNRVVVVDGIDNTNWGDQVKAIIQANLPPASPSNYTEAKCNKALAGWDLSAKTSGLIQDVSRIAGELQEADPASKLLWGSYYNPSNTGHLDGTSVDHLLPTACEKPVSRALTRISTAIKQGLQDYAYTWFNADADSAMHMQSDRVQPIFCQGSWVCPGAKDDAGQGWPHPTPDGAAAIAALVKL